MNEINALIKEASDSSLAPSATCSHGKKIAMYALACRLSPDTESARILILNFPAFRTVIINVCCLSHPVYGIFIRAVQTD